MKTNEDATISGATTTSSSNINTTGQFVKGVMGSPKSHCKKCGYEYIEYSESTKCPNCTLSEMRMKSRLV